MSLTSNGRTKWEVIPPSANRVFTVNFTRTVGIPLKIVELSVILGTTSQSWEADTICALTLQAGESDQVDVSKGVSIKAILENN